MKLTNVQLEVLTNAVYGKDILRELIDKFNLD